MKNILQKMHLIQAEVQKMEKDGHNSFQNYNYLSETQITLKMKELFDKHKVMFIPTSTTQESITETSPTAKGAKQFITTVRVKYMFADIETGESIEGVMDGQGSDTGDKGIYKAITGACKYIQMKTFNIPTGDDAEKDSASSVKASTNKQQTQNTTIVNPNQPGTKLCEVHNVEMPHAVGKSGKSYWGHRGESGEICFGQGYLDTVH